MHALASGERGLELLAHLCLARLLRCKQLHPMRDQTDACRRLAFAHASSGGAAAAATLPPPGAIDEVLAIPDGEAPTVHLTRASAGAAAEECAQAGAPGIGGAEAASAASEVAPTVSRFASAHEASSDERTAGTRAVTLTLSGLDNAAQQQPVPQVTDAALRQQESTSAPSAPMKSGRGAYYCVAWSGAGGKGAAYRKLRYRKLRGRRRRRGGRQ